MDPVLLDYPFEEASDRLASIEDQELNSPLGILSVELYSEFLGLYLLTGDLANAKLLWKRIPADMKVTNDELKAIWEVGKAAWQHDYAGVHEKITACEWTETIKRIMKQYKTNVTNYCFDMVADGYISIKLTYLSSILGLTKSNTIEAIKERKWTYLEENEIVKPEKAKKEFNYAIKNEEHLEKLTRHILYLES